MALRKFRVIVSGSFIVELDESLTPDDEWRDTFYNSHKLSDIAELIVWNRGLGDVRFVEGVGNGDGKDWPFFSCDDEDLWKWDTEEITTKYA